MQDEFDLGGAPFYLFIGDADRESVVSKLKTEGIEYRRKMLESGKENWAKIIEMLSRSDLSGVLLKLPAHSWKRLLDPDFLPLTEQIFAKVAARPHVAFIHDGVFSPDLHKESSDEWYYEFSEPFQKLSSEEIVAAKSVLAKHNIEVAYYQTNAEMSVIAMEFLDRNAHGLVFRIYVPNEQLFAREIGRIVDLFREYLRKVSNINLKEERYSTDSGYILEFFADDDAGSIDLPTEFEKFGRFMDDCVTDAEAAQGMLQLKSIAPATAMQIVDRFAVETKRIVIDVRHERERRLLSVRQKLETELVDEIKDDAEFQEVMAYAAKIIPELPLVGSAGNLALPGSNTTTINVRTESLNFDQRVIDRVTNIAVQEMSGNIVLSSEAEHLIELIEKHGGDKTQDLINAVYEIEDSGQKSSARLLSGGKIRSFLERSRDKIEGVLWGVLEAYIKSRLGM